MGSAAVPAAAAQSFATPPHPGMGETLVLRWATCVARMRALLLLGLLVPMIGCTTDQQAAGIDNRISLGMGFDEAIAVIKRHGGEDITSGKQVMTAPGVTPNRGGYWWLQTYKIQIAIGERDSRVSGLSYWDGRDLGVSKIQEGKTERRVKSLTFDSANRSVSYERFAER